MNQDSSRSRPMASLENFNYIVRIRQDSASWLRVVMVGDNEGRERPHRGGA